jgi:hypothetical protein
MSVVFDGLPFIALDFEFAGAGAEREAEEVRVAGSDRQAGGR